MEVGKLLRGVTVGHVERPGLVWVNAPPTEESDALLKKVEMMSLEKWPPGDQPTVGTLVAVRFSEDGLIYRAKVLSVEESVSTVRFIDYGNTEQKTFKEMFRLPSSLAKEDGLAVPVAVYGAESTKDSAKNRDRVAAKLSKPNLEVFLSTPEESFGESGLLVGEFSYKGKLVTFSKKTEAKKASAGVEDEEVLNVPPAQEQIKTDVIVDLSPVKCSEEPKPEQVKSSKPEVTQEKPKEVVQENPKPKEEAPVMFSSLPRLALLDEVRTTGNVVFVSPEACIWFSPLWAQEKLEEVTQIIDALAEGGLRPVNRAKEGMLCVARSEDGCLYRARVVEVGKRTSVQFIDFGNSEDVDEVYHYHAFLGMLAPAAAEVVLARTLLSSGEAKKVVLDDCLIGEEGKSLELQLERDKETGMQVARFYEQGVEVVFDNKIEPVVDVVVEAEGVDDHGAVAEPDVNKNFSPEELKVIEERRPLVECAALPEQGKVEVVLVLVEDVRTVWVVRKELEQKLDKMAGALQRQASKLEVVQSPEVGCVYATKFSQDQQMYRAVVEKAEGDMVSVRYIDFGNREVKDKSELLHLPEKMAKWPACAQSVFLEDNKEADDSQVNRDEVEEGLEENIELVLAGGKVVRLESKGSLVKFSFNKKRASKGKEVPRSQEKLRAEVAQPKVKPEESNYDGSLGRKLIQENTTESNLMDESTTIAVQAEKKKSPTTTPSCGSTAESPLEAFDRMEEVIAVPVIESEDVCKTPAPTENEKGGLVKDFSVPPSNLTSATPIFEAAAPSSELAAHVAKEPLRSRHVERSTYVPPALRNGNSAAKRCLAPEVSPGTVAALKSMLEKELPKVSTGKGDGGEKGPKLESLGTKKVNDWFARNDAVRLKEETVATEDVLKSAKFDIVEPPLSSSSPCRQAQGMEGGCVETNLAVKDLDRMLKQSSAAALMTTRETSLALQDLVPLLPSAALQPLVDAASQNFEVVATQPSGCRVIQVLLKSNCSRDQLHQLTSHLREEPATLIKLTMDKFGTFVAQESLPYVVESPQVLTVVKAIGERMGQLGSNLHASFFLQKFLEVASGKGIYYILQEEILANIRLLAFSEAGSRLIQAVLRKCGMSSVVRVARWLEMCMQQVVENGPATFAAIAVLDRVLEKAKSDKTWLVMLDRVATALLVAHTNSQLPLVVEAALHPEAHLLAREVAAKSNLLSSSRAGLLCALQKHVDTLKLSRTGAGALKALHRAL